MKECSSIALGVTAVVAGVCCVCVGGRRIGLSDTVKGQTIQCTRVFYIRAPSVCI